MAIMTGASNYSGEWEDSESGGVACATGKSCAEADYAGNPMRGPRAFCRSDENRIGAAVRDLPERYVRVHMKLAKAGQQDGERVSGGAREAPVPLDLETEAFLRHLLLVTLSWEDAVREALDLHNPDQCPACKGDGVTATGGDCPACRGSGRVRARAGVQMDRACGLLAGTWEKPGGHLVTLLGLPPSEALRPVSRFTRLADLEPGTVIRIDAAGDAWQRRPMGGADAGLEFLALSARIRSFLGLTLRSRRILVPCDGDGCGSLTLVQREAVGGGWEDLVRCTGCGFSYTGEPYKLLMSRWYQALVDAEKARKVP